MDTQKLRELLAKRDSTVNVGSAADMAIYAECRAALPALLAEIDRLQGALRDALGPADEAMKMAGWEALFPPDDLGEPNCGSLWTAMAAVRLRGMTGGGAI